MSLKSDPHHSRIIGTTLHSLPAQETWKYRSLPLFSYTTRSSPYIAYSAISCNGRLSQLSKQICNLNDKKKPYLDIGYGKIHKNFEANATSKSKVSVSQSHRATAKISNCS